VQGISMQCRGIKDALLHAVCPRQAVAARHAATCGEAHACNAVASRVAKRMQCPGGHVWLCAAVADRRCAARNAE
jgi:hypothetical protein